MKYLLLLLCALHRVVEGRRPQREEAPGHAKMRSAHRRSREHALQSELLQERAEDIARSELIGITKYTTSAKNKVASPHWRCCPSDWFSTRKDERRGEVFLVRPFKSGTSTLQMVLWSWATRRSIPIVSVASDLNSSGFHSPKGTLVDARLPYQDLARVAHQRHSTRTAIAAKEQRQQEKGRLRKPTFSVFLAEPEPLFVTVLRPPLDRAVAIFYWAHRTPEAIATTRRASPRLWRREPKGQFSREHLAHLQAFATRQPGRKLLGMHHRDQDHVLRKRSDETLLPSHYHIIPQWSFFSEDSPSAAGNELRRGHFLLGFVSEHCSVDQSGDHFFNFENNRFDELLVMLRWRLNLSSSLEILTTVSTNHYRAPSAASIPQRILEVLNASKPVVEDHVFVNFAEEQYAEQLRSFGHYRSPAHKPVGVPRARTDSIFFSESVSLPPSALTRLEREVAELRTVRRALRRKCDPNASRLELRSKREFLPPCRKNCEGHLRLSKCMEKAFLAEYSEDAKRSEAKKEREYQKLLLQKQIKLGVGVGNFVKDGSSADVDGGSFALKDKFRKRAERATHTSNVILAEPSEWERWRPPPQIEQFL